MTKHVLALTLLSLGASPALATGGFDCRTAGNRPIAVSLAFGHVPGSALVSARLVDKGRIVPVSRAQWWLDRSELRLVLVDPDATREEVIIRARRNGPTYDGSLWRGGRRSWVRCRGD